MANSLTIAECEAAIAAANPHLGAWSWSFGAEADAYVETANEAADMTDGRDLFPVGKDVSVRFRDDLTIRYLGERADHMGCGYYGFLFSVPGRLEVVTWIEDAKVLVRLNWRGERAVLQEVALALRMFQGVWLARHDEAA